MTCCTSCNYAVGVLSLYDQILVGGVYLTLLSRKETCTYLYALSTQHEACADTSAVSYAACGDNRYLNCIDYLGYKAHGCVLTDMSAGFGTLSDNCVSTASLHSLCQCNGGNYGYYLYICILPALHELSGIARTCCYERYALFDDQFCKVFRIGAHQHDVHAERLVANSLFCKPYLLTKIVYRCRTACDYTCAACICYGTCKGMFSYPCHAALKYGVLYTEKLGYPCFCGSHSTYLTL